MSLPFEVALGVLRAAAESTRLRLLALLRHGELTVGEITAVLGHSQPRVSRHLKLLCDMNLLDRFREEHWVYYRVPVTGPGAALVGRLLALTESDDAIFKLDRERMASVVAGRVAPVSSGGRVAMPLPAEQARGKSYGDSVRIKGESMRIEAPDSRQALPTDRSMSHRSRDLPQAPAVDPAAETAVASWASPPAAIAEFPDAGRDFCAAVAAVLGGEPLGDLLDIGTGSGNLLKLLAGRASHAVGLDISSDALRRARGQVHGAGLSHCVFRRGDMHSLPFAQPEFDTVVIDRALAHTDHPVGVLKEAARTLRSGGRMLVIDDYDRLAELGGLSRDGAPRSPTSRSDNPLTEMRRWLAAAGLEVGRLFPLDTPEAHLLLAECRRMDRKIAA